MLKVSVLLLTLFSWSFQASAQTSSTPQELKIGLAQDFDTLNPNISSMLSSTYIYNMVARKLISLDENMKWQPQMAEKIPSLENGGAKIFKENGVEKIRATWTLRKGAQWGDGVPVTCTDVQFSQEVGSSKQVAVVNRDSYDQVERVECEKENPSVIHFVHPSVRWDFFKMVQFYILPEHLEKKIFTEMKDQKEGYDKNSLYVKDLTNPGLFNGPYLISEFKIGSQVVLIRNPKFYGEPAKISKIVVKIIPNSSTLESQLLTREIDMVPNIGFNLDQALIFDKKVQKDKLPFVVKYEPALIYEHIDFNLDHPILKDIKARKALRLAVDRELMVNSFFEGKQQASAHFLSPRDPWFAKSGIKKAPFNFSRRASEQLWEELGWMKNEKDGYRYKNGQRLSLVLSTTAGNKGRETIETFLLDQWKKVGVEVVIKNLPPRVFFGDLMKNRKFEAMAMYAWSFLPENVPTQFYHSAQVPTEMNSFSGRNYMNWKNPQVDKAMADLEIERNPNKRGQLISQIVKGYVNDMPTLPLYHRADVSVAPKNLAGYHPTGHQQMETNFVENWHF